MHRRSERERESEVISEITLMHAVLSLMQAAKQGWAFGLVEEVLQLQVSVHNASSQEVLSPVSSYSMSPIL